MVIKGRGGLPVQVIRLQSPFQVMIGAVITIKQARGEWVEVKLVRENHYEYKTPD